MAKRLLDVVHTVTKHDRQPSELCFECTQKKLDNPCSHICKACFLKKLDNISRRSPHFLMKYDLQPSLLCSRCSQLDLHSKWGYSHYNFEQLKASAVSDHCPLCKLFFKSLSFVGIRNNPSTNITLIPNSTGKRLVYRLDGVGERKFDVVREQQDGGRVSTDFRLTSPIPLDDRNLAVINQWLRSCSMEHDRCKPTTSFSSPTRLLDIRGPQLRLVSPWEKNVRYTILSYCWGVNTRLVTTESTIELFHEKIDWSALPATFKDAITTSRKLNVDYIWIDSLCISQDSRIDWERECQKMGDYYKNAYLTLSALDSPDSDAGFLHPRNNLAVKLSTPNTWIRSNGRVSSIIFRDSYLNKRGWALQERLLSTRILHFSKDEVLWECLTCSATESSFKKHYELVDMSSLIYCEGRDFKRAALHLGPDPFSLTDGAFAAWYRIVVQFSRRSLTYETDRLPAISGVARLIGERMGLTYIAGLWEQDPHGLVWFINKNPVNYPKDRVSHPSTICKDASAVDFDCPSWSWAKTKQSVSWPFYDQPRTDTDGDAKFVQSEIVSTLRDPYRATKTAELELEVTTLDVQCKSRIWRITERFSLQIFHDGFEIGIGCFDSDDLENAEIMVNCTAINIAERKGAKSSFKYNYFLLVQRSSQESGAWGRIGMGMTSSKAPEKSVFEGLPKQVIRLR